MDRRKWRPALERRVVSAVGVRADPSLVPCVRQRAVSLLAVEADELRLDDHLPTGTERPDFLDGPLVVALTGHLADLAFCDQLRAVPARPRHADGRAAVIGALLTA